MAREARRRRDDLRLHEGFLFPGYRAQEAERLFSEAARGLVLPAVPGPVRRVAARAGRPLAASLELLWLHFASLRRCLDGTSARTAHLEKMRLLLFSAACQGYSSSCLWRAVEGVGREPELVGPYAEAIGEHSFGAALDLAQREWRRAPLSPAAYDSYLRHSPVFVVARLAARWAAARSGRDPRPALEELARWRRRDDLRRESFLLAEIGRGGSPAEFLRRPRLAELRLPRASRRALGDILRGLRPRGGDVAPRVERLLRRRVFTPGTVAELRSRSAAAAEPGADSGRGTEFWPAG